MVEHFDVSVVVPAYQAESYLAKTLQTVADQTEWPSKLIIADDGSTDRTCEVIQSFVQAYPKMCVELLREPHRGPGAARNAGVRHSDSRWIAFLDSDDLWHPEKLATMRRAIEAHPGANFFCHNESIKETDGSERSVDYGAGFSFHRPVSRQLYERNRFSTSAVVCRRKLVIQWGGFDEGLSSAQDYELWLRMSPDLVPFFVKDVLGTYIVRDGNISTRRFWRRLLNILRVKHRHRKKGGTGNYLYSMVHSTLSYTVAQLQSVRRGANRGTATP